MMSCCFDLDVEVIKNWTIHDLTQLANFMMVMDLEKSWILTNPWKWLKSQKWSFLPKTRFFDIFSKKLGFCQKPTFIHDGTLVFVKKPTLAKMGYFYARPPFWWKNCPTFGKISEKCFRYPFLSTSWYPRLTRGVSAEVRLLMYCLERGVTP